MPQIIPNCHYKCSCALHSPSPNSVFSSTLRCSFLASSSPVFPRLHSSVPAKPELPLCTHRSFSGGTFSLLISLAACAAQSILAASPWYIKCLLPQLLFSTSWVCQLWKSKSPSSAYFSCTMSCTFLSDDLDFPLIPSSTASIGIYPVLLSEVAHTLCLGQKC